MSKDSNLRESPPGTSKMAKPQHDCPFPFRREGIYIVAFPQSDFHSNERGNTNVQDFLAPVSQEIFLSVNRAYAYSPRLVQHAEE
jgi:hypothetical protein